MTLKKTWSSGPMRIRNGRSGGSTRKSNSCSDSLCRNCRSSASRSLSGRPLRSTLEKLHRARRLDDLHRVVVDEVVRRAENLVACDEAVERLLESLRVDRPVKAEGRGSVVGDAAALELAQEPQAAPGSTTTAPARGPPGARSGPTSAEAARCSRRRRSSNARWASLRRASRAWTSSLPPDDVTAASFLPLRPPGATGRPLRPRVLRARRSAPACPGRGSLPSARRPAATGSRRSGS